MANQRSDEVPVEQPPVTIFGPDFPFPFDGWLEHPAGLGSVPPERHGEEVAIVGAGISGLIAAYELMRLGLKPVVYEASQMGGRLRSQQFEGAPPGVIAELGGMRFPVSSTAFYHYVDMLGLETKPFPNPLTPASGSTVIDIEGVTHYAEQPGMLPPLFREVADADPERDPRPRHQDAEVAVGRARAAVGRPHVLRLHRHLRGLLEAVVPPSGGVRPGGLRDGRLGLRLPELHAGDLPGRDDEL
jgi:hypothetical protein